MTDDSNGCRDSILIGFTAIDNPDGNPIGLESGDIAPGSHPLGKAHWAGRGDGPDTLVMFED